MRKVPLQAAGQGHSLDAAEDDRGKGKARRLSSERVDQILRPKIVNETTNQIK